MSRQENEALQLEDAGEHYVDVRRLQLRAPQSQPPPERATRRPWHPVMWDDSILGLPPPDHVFTAEEESQQQAGKREYPHKQRIRNLRRLIEQGKVKPTSETLIFFLCNKFAVADDRQGKA